MPNLESNLFFTMSPTNLLISEIEGAVFFTFIAGKAGFPRLRRSQHHHHHYHHQHLSNNTWTTTHKQQQQQQQLGARYVDFQSTEEESIDFFRAHSSLTVFRAHVVEWESDCHLLGSKTLRTKIQTLHQKTDFNWIAISLTGSTPKSNARFTTGNLKLRALPGSWVRHHPSFPLPTCGFN